MKTSTLVPVLVAALAAFISGLAGAADTPKEAPKKDAGVLGALASRVGENPLKNAVVGDWIEFVMATQMKGLPGGGDAMAQKMETKVKQTVLAKDETSVTLRMETTVRGNAMSRDAKIALDKPYEPYTQGLTDAVVTPLGDGDETITVGGKAYACHWVKVKVVATKPVASESTSKVWTSKDVPVNGLVKMETDSSMDMNGQKMETKLTMELTGSGRK